MDNKTLIFSSTLVASVLLLVLLYQCVPAETINRNHEPIYSNVFNNGQTSLNQNVPSSNYNISSISDGHSTPDSSSSRNYTTDRQQFTQQNQNDVFATDKSLLEAPEKREHLTTSITIDDQSSSPMIPSQNPAERQDYFKGTATERGVSSEYEQQNTINSENGGNKDRSQQQSLPELASNIRITGSVIDANGGLLADIPLTLKLIQALADDKALFGDRTLRTQTDDNGHYKFLNLVEGEYQICTVGENSYNRVCKNVRAPYSTADFTLLAAQNGSIYGLVTDEQGEPLAGVTVRASPYQIYNTMTNEEGQFELSMAVNHTLTYQIYFDKTGYADLNVSANGNEIQRSKQLDVSLAPLSGFSVEGYVHDQFSTAISGINVRFHSPAIQNKSPLQARSDQDGFFTIKFIQAADDYNLTVFSNRYSYDKIKYQNIRLYNGMPVLDIALKSTDLGVGSFSVTLMNPGGERLDGVTLQLRADSHYSTNMVTGNGGQAIFDEIPVKQEGSNLTILSNSDTPKYIFSGYTLVEGENKLENLIVSKGNNSLQVIVLDNQRYPIEGAKGTLVWTHKSGSAIHTTRRTGKTSQENTGAINYSALTFGTHILTVIHPAYQEHQVEVDIYQSGQYHEVVLLKK